MLDVAVEFCDSDSRPSGAGESYSMAFMPECGGDSSIHDLLLDEPVEAKSQL